MEDRHEQGKAGAHVLILPGQSPDVVALARELAPTFGVHPLDLAQVLRYGGGWILRDAPPEEVTAALEALVKQGVTARRLEGELAGEPPVRAIRQLTFDGSRLAVEVASVQEEIPIEDLRLLDLVALGNPEAPRPVAGDWARDARVLATAIRGFPFDDARQALLKGDLRPLVTLVAGDPAVFYRIERGTLLPHYAEVMGGVWLDNLLTFLHHLLPALPRERVSPRTWNFWYSASDGNVEHDASSDKSSDESSDESSDDTPVEAIVMTKEEELGNRLAWWHELLSRDLWKGAP